jgi:V/A-type H+-transporting ATPase subunit A
MIREDFLHQNAFDDRDTYTSLGKQFMLLHLILRYYDDARNCFADGGTLESLLRMDALDDIARAKLIPDEDIDEFKSLEQRISDNICAITW